MRERQNSADPWVGVRRALSFAGRVLFLLATTGLTLLSASAGGASSERGQPAPSALAGVANSPVRFELAHDAGNPVFLARGFNYQCYLAPTRARIFVRKPVGQIEQPPNERRSLNPFSWQFDSRSMSMSFDGANPEARIEGREAIPGSVNYIRGNNPAQWRTGSQNFNRVKVKNLYPGIDLVYYGNQRRLEYDFEVAPGANPRDIVIEFSGADQVNIDPRGELVVTLGIERITHPRPVLFQWANGFRRPVSGSYRLIGPGRVGFAIEDYDRSETLIIDPILSYSTLFGGNFGDLALAVKVDYNGFVYVAGETLSTDFPFALSGFDTNFGGGKINGDAFVAKFTPTASALVYFTYLGGSGNDGALDLAVDSAGHAHVCGFTDSPDFPVKNALYPTIHGKPTPDNGIYQQDAFITELDATGQSLVYSTYFGGTNIERADAIALDPAGATYITGATYSPDFPLLSALPGQRFLHGPYDAFVAKFGPGGSPLIYSTFLGGTNADEGQGIAVDSNGAAYVTGFTSSTNFPTTPGAYRTNLNGYVKLTPLFDAFVAKINPAGGSLAYSTLLGGTNTDSGFRIAVDGGGNAFVTGSTMSLDFPNTATNLGLSVGFTNIAAANSDAFITKLAPNGALAWSIRCGGVYTDVGWDIALDPSGNLFVVGTTSSTDFPVLRDIGFPTPSKARVGYESIFLTAVKQDASEAVYSLLMGGSLNDQGYGIAADPAGNAYIVGKVTSTNFPVVRALQSSVLGASDSFLAKLAVVPTLQSDLSGQAIEVRWRAFAPEFELAYRPNLAPDFSWVPVEQAPVLSNGWHTVTVGTTNPSSFFRLRLP